MTTNVCFALLDSAVIAGRGEQTVVGDQTFVRLLEETAALGGALQHLGVGPGVPVVIDLEDDHDAIVAVLAAARIGAVVSATDLPDAPVVVVSAGSGVSGAGRLRVVRGDDVEEPDLAWGLMLRAGRSEPAACEELAADATYAPGRSVGEQITDLAATAAPYDAADLRRLLQV